MTNYTISEELRIVSRVRGSPLFVPGDRPDRIVKAMGAGADAVVTRARRLVEAYKAVRSGVCVLDGEAVGRRAVLSWRRMLALAETAGNAQ
jgi:citrate lyase beta subunit